MPFARTASAAPRSSTTSPRGRSVKAIQCFLRADALARADEEGPHVVAGEDARRATPGARASATTTFAPASVARRAASTLLAIPPVPTPPVDSRTRGSASRATSRTRGMRCPSPSSRPSTSLRSTRRSASTSGATIAASWSLSPNLISSTATESFSLRMGTAPASSSAPSARAGVVGARAVGEVGVREEHLRDRAALRGERLLVRAHEDALPRRGRGLEPSHLLGAGAVAELLHAERDGAARDDDERPLARRDGGGEALEEAAVGRDRARADLDDDPARARELRARVSHPRARAGRRTRRRGGRRGGPGRRPRARGGRRRTSSRRRAGRR